MLQLHELLEQRLLGVYFRHLVEGDLVLKLLIVEVRDPDGLDRLLGLWTLSPVSNLQQLLAPRLDEVADRHGHPRAVSGGHLLLLRILLALRLVPIGVTRHVVLGDWRQLATRRTTLLVFLPRLEVLLRNLLLVLRIQDHLQSAFEAGIACLVRLFGLILILHPPFLGPVLRRFHCVCLHVAQTTRI